MVITTVMLSISFLVYIIVGQWLFGFYLGWFPVQGWSDSFFTNLTYYAVLPVSLAVFVSLAPQTRLYRSFFLDEINQDYVRTARATGVGENRVLFTHVLRNAMIPVLTNVAFAAARCIHQLVLIEVFLHPGLGREILLAVNRSDYPVIQAVTIYLAVLTMLINLTADILYRKWSIRGSSSNDCCGMNSITSVESIRVPPEPSRSRGVSWVTAWRRLKNDRVGVASLVTWCLSPCWCCCRFWVSSPAAAERGRCPRCAADFPRPASGADGNRSARECSGEGRETG